MVRANTKCRTHCSIWCWWGEVRLQERITGNTENAAQRLRIMALSSTCHCSGRQKWREGKIFEKGLEMGRTALEGSYQNPQKFKTVTQPWSGTHKLTVLLFLYETEWWMQWRQGISCLLLCPQYLKQRCYRRHLVSACWIRDLMEAECTTPHTWESKSHWGKSSPWHWPSVLFFCTLSTLDHSGCFLFAHPRVSAVALSSCCRRSQGMPFKTHPQWPGCWGCLRSHPVCY